MRSLPLLAVGFLVACSAPPGVDDGGAAGGAGGSAAGGGAGGSAGGGAAGGSGGGTAGGTGGGAGGGTGGGTAGGAGGAGGGAAGGAGGAGGGAVGGGSGGGSGGDLVVDLADAGPAVLIDGGYGFIEGPQWVPASGHLLFSDINGNRIWRHVPPATFTVWRPTSNMSNGIALAPNGDLIVCEHATAQVTRTRPDGGTAVVASAFNGATLNSPNDAVVRSDGTIYFTDPTYGGTGSVGTRGAYRVAPDGGLTQFYATTQGQPNGVALSPNGALLYVADSQLSTVRRFDVAADGTPSNGVVFVNTTQGGAGGNGGDGITTDDNGFLYVSTSVGIKVWRPDGGYHGTISVGRVPANCAFGEADRRTLFITAQDRLFKVRLNVTGPY